MIEKDNEGRTTEVLGGFRENNSGVKIQAKESITTLNERRKLVKCSEKPMRWMLTF